MKTCRDIKTIAVDAGYGVIKTNSPSMPTGIKPCDNGTIFGSNVLVSAT